MGHPSVMRGVPTPLSNLRHETSSTTSEPTYPVRSGMGCVMSSLGMVRMGSCVMEPFFPMMRPARS